MQKLPALPDVHAAECAPFMFGAEWRIGSRIASAVVLADMSRSQRMRAAAELVPEVGLAKMASAALNRPEVIERVINAVERAMREQEARQLQESAASGEKASATCADEAIWDRFRQNERARLPDDWSKAKNWPVSDTLVGGYSVAHATSLKNFTRTAKEGDELLSAAVAAAAAELEAWARAAFGSEAVLGARWISPREMGSLAERWEENWALAMAEQAALKNTVKTASELPNDAAASKAQRSPPGANQEAAIQPREMLGWNFPLALDPQIQQPGSARITGVVVGLDITQSQVVQGMAKHAPHLALAEVAAALLNSEAVAEKMVACYEKSAKDSDVSMGREFGAEKRAFAKELLRKSWALPTAIVDEKEGGGGNAEARTTARLSVCWSDNGAVPGLRLLDGDRAERPERGRAAAERIRTAMQSMAEEIFGEQAVAFSRTVDGRETAIRLLAAHAQKIELERAAGLSREAALAEPAHKPRKPRSL